MSSIMTAPKEHVFGTAAELTVFYDGSCPLCRAEIGVYTKSQGAEQIAFVDVAAINALQVCTGLDRASAMARFHVMRSDGTLASGAAGFARLWLALPRWRWLGRFVMLPFVSPAAEFAYRLFLPIRPMLQRLWRWRYPDPPLSP
jgi:predicted DCC family thiol-disulfide oxidoreductase YuxK